MYWTILWIKLSCVGNWCLGSDTVEAVFHWSAYVESAFLPKRYRLSYSVGRGERDGLCHGAVFVFPFRPIPELVRQRNVKAGMLANASGETHTDRAVGLPAGIISTFMLRAAPNGIMEEDEGQDCYSDFPHHPPAQSIRRPCVITPTYSVSFYNDRPLLTTAEEKLWTLYQPKLAEWGPLDGIGQWLP